MCQNYQDLCVQSGSDILRYIWTCRASVIYDSPINWRYIQKRCPALVLMRQIRLTSSNCLPGSFVLMWKVLCQLESYMVLPVVADNIFYKDIISLSSISLLVLIWVSKLHFTKAERKFTNFSQKTKLSGEVHHHPDLPTKVLRESICVLMTKITPSIIKRLDPCSSDQISKCVTPLFLRYQSSRDQRRILAPLIIFLIFFLPLKKKKTETFRRKRSCLEKFTTIQICRPKFWGRVSYARSP